MGWRSNQAANGVVSPPRGLSQRGLFFFLARPCKASTERERERVVSSRGKPRVYVLHFEIDVNVCAVRAETHIKAKIV